MMIGCGYTRHLELMRDSHFSQIENPRDQDVVEELRMKMMMAIKMIEHKTLVLQANIEHIIVKNQTRKPHNLS